MVLALILAVAAALPTAPMSVIDARSNLHALDGKTVAVRGWLDRCERLSCALFPTLAAARRRDYSGPRLSLAGSPVVDDRAAELAHREIVIEGVVSDRCHQAANGEVVVCTDRAPDLTPIRIIDGATASQSE